MQPIYANIGTNVLGYRRLLRLGKFGIVGASGIGINLALFWTLTELLHLDYLVAGLIAIEFALCSNYFFNNNWTFVDRRRGALSFDGLLRYHVVSVGGMAINLAVLRLLAGGAGIAPVFANLAGIAAASSWNFFLSVHWTWRRASASALSARGGLLTKG